MSKAVYAGSFDPPTIGHQWMINECLTLFGHEHLVVAIANNPDKKYTFSLPERVAMVHNIALDLSITAPKVEVIGNEFLVDWAIANQCTHLIRGIRNASDFQYEQAMRNINRDRSTEIETVFLMPPRELCEISSSMVKGLVGVEGWEVLASHYVTPGVSNALAKKLLQKTVPVPSPAVTPATTFSSIAASILASTLTTTLPENPTRSEYTKYVFNQWCRLFTDRDYKVAVETFSLIEKAYTSPDRHYHTLQHLAECLEELHSNYDFNEDNSKGIRSVTLALFFHDLVYDTHTKPGENEAASAEALRLFIQDHRPYWMVTTAYDSAKFLCEWVLETQHIPHELKYYDHQFYLSLLLDIDLSILGKSSERFEQYEKQIRKEYAWVDGPTYSSVRCSILKGILNRPVIYKTEKMRARYEKQARLNLAQSIARLEKANA